MPVEGNCLPFTKMGESAGDAEAPLPPVPEPPPPVPSDKARGELADIKFLETARMTSLAFLVSASEREFSFQSFVTCHVCHLIQLIGGSSKDRGRGE